MSRNEEIIKELNEISPLLAGLPVHLPYGFPHGYFSNFPEITLIKIKSLQPVQHIPDGYFENFASKMVLLARADEVSLELAAAAPFLMDMPKAVPFEVPAGYFEHFTLPAQKEDQHQTKAKVFSLFGLKARNWAAAAAVSIGMLAGAWWYLTPQHSTTGNEKSTEVLAKQLEGLNPNEMMAYLNQEDKYMAEFATTLFNEEESIEKQLEKIQTQELIQYLKTENLNNPKS